MWKNRAASAAPNEGGTAGRTRPRAVRAWRGAASALLILAGTGAAAVVVAPSPAGASGGSTGPTAPDACTAGPGVDTFVGSTNDPTSWNDPVNWSSGSIPGVGDIACIPEAYPFQVSFNANDAIPNYQIRGVNDESPLGLAVTSAYMELTDPTVTSVVTNLTVDGLDPNAGIGVDAGVTLDLTGGATLSDSLSQVAGPGTLNVLHDSSLDLGPDTSLIDGLVLDNWGTVDGVGAGVCQNTAAAPGVIENEPTGLMSFSGGGGLGESCSYLDPTGGAEVENDAGATLRVSTDPFALSLPFDNEGTVSVGSGELDLSAGNTGGRGIDTGTYAPVGSGLVTFSAPRDLSAAVLTGSGTLGFYAINAGINLGGQRIANVIQTGTTTGGMTVTKSLQFRYSELGNNDLSDLPGQTTTTSIARGATVSFSGWGATLMNGHDLVVQPGATVDLASESMCVQDGSSLVNEGKFEISGTSESVGGCGSTGTMVNAAGGAMTSSGSTVISVPFDNEGTVTASTGTLDVDGSNSGANGSDTGTWTASAKGTVDFNSPRDLSGARMTGGGTFGFNAIGAGVNLGGQTLASVVQTGTTTGGMTVTRGLTFAYSELGNNDLSDLPGVPTTTYVAKGATVSFAGWGATLENGHNLTVEDGAKVLLAGESICVQAGSSLVNDGTVTLSGSNPNVNGCGGSGSMSNGPTGTVTASSSGSIGIPFDNEGRTTLTGTGTTLTVDGGSGATENGSWTAPAGTSLAFESGTTTLSATAPVSVKGTVVVGCGATVALAGQSVASMVIAGATSGPYTVTGSMSFSGFPDCGPPVIAVPSGTVKVAGNFTPQAYNGTEVEVTVSGATAFGQLAVAGTASVAGDTLAIDTAPGFTPALGATFQVMTAHATAGNFSLVGDTCAGTGLGYQTVPDAAGVEVQVVGDASCP